MKLCYPVRLPDGSAEERTIEVFYPIRQVVYHITDSRYEIPYVIINFVIDDTSFLYKCADKEGESKLFYEFELMLAPLPKSVGYARSNGK